MASGANTLAPNGTTQWYHLGRTSPAIGFQLFEICGNGLFSISFDGRSVTMVGSFQRWRFSCHLEKVKETSSKILLFGAAWLQQF